MAEPNFDPNQPVVIYGLQSQFDAAAAAAVNPIKGYTQTAMRTTTLVLLLGVRTEILFTPAMLTKLEPGGNPELVIDAAGRMTIPDTAVGRWQPQVTVRGDATLSLAMTAEIEVRDAAGAIVGTYATTGYPAKRTESLASGSEKAFSGYRPIGHLSGTGALTVRLFLTAAVGLGITTIELTLNKSG